jgi:RHS repeat-associated protein
MRYTFDRAGRLTQVREAAGTARVMKSFTYGTSGTSNGKLLTAVRNNYHDTPANVVITETYTYGGRQGRVSARTVAASSGASANFSQFFTWNELGQPATTGYPACTTSPCSGAPGPARTVTSNYTRGYLSSVAGFTNTITYHANGMVNQIPHVNGMTVTRANDPNRMARPASIAASSGAGASWSSGTYTYDGAGNIKGIGSNFYYYNGSKTLRFVYTADEERVATYDQLLNRWTWRLRGLDNKVLREYRNQGGTWSWQKDWIHRGSSLLATDEPSIGTRHFALDHLGTPRLITSSMGAQVSLHNYYPYGVEATSETQDAEVMKFTGHERDTEFSGDVNSLDYMHARYYSPVMGRFLSVDPIVAVSRNKVSPQRWNRYAYVSGSPLKYVDPDGREQVTFGDRRLEGLVLRLQSRHPQVRATLERYRGPGTPDLHIERGKAGLDRDGSTRAQGVLNTKFDPRYDLDRIQNSGARQDESSILPATGRFLRGSVLLGATLTLDNSLTPNSSLELSTLLHEFGHAEAAAADPDRYLSLGADDVVFVDGQLLPWASRPLEHEAERYRLSVEPRR